MSTRSIRSVGNVLVSGDTPLLKMSAPTWRRPSTRTSVRCVPRPRRSSRFKPAVPRKRVEFDWLKVLRSDGSSFSVSPIATFPVWKNSPPPMLVTGTVDSRLGRAIRDPVTTIAWPASSGQPASVSSAAHCAAVGAAWARAVWGINRAALASAVAARKRLATIRGFLTSKSKAPRRPLNAARLNPATRNRPLCRREASIP